MGIAGEVCVGVDSLDESEIETVVNEIYKAGVRATERNVGGPELPALLMESDVLRDRVLPPDEPSAEFLERSKVFLESIGRA